MASLLNIILQVVLLLWKHKGKTTFAAVLAAATGGGTYAWLESQRPEPEVQAFHGGAGVPSNPPGVVPNDAPADGEFLKWVDPTGAEWAAGGAGASSLPDLSDVAGTLTGDNGDILAFDGTDWDDLTLEEVFTAGIGNGTDNYVLTTDGAGVIAWEAASGGSGITYDGTVTDGQIPVYDDTANEYIPTYPGGPVFSVRNPISFDPAGAPTARMVRASGSMKGTTGTIDVGADANSMTVAASWDGARGHGVVISGAGAAHGISAPSAPFVMPMTADLASESAGASDTAMSFTSSTITGRFTPSEQLVFTDGVGIRFSNQAGDLPTVGGTPLTQTSTLYYARNFVEVQTIVVAGTPTGGTYRICNPVTRETVSVAYNASSATVQTALRTLTGFGSVTVAESGSTPNFTHTITFTGVATDTPQLTSDWSTLTGGTPSVTHATSTSGGFKVYPTSADAIADTNVLVIDGNGSGTHYCWIEGSTTREYDASVLSGNGGWTDDGSDAQTTTSNDTLNVYTRNRVFIPAVTDAEGYVFFGDSTTDGDRYIFSRINKTPTCLAIVADAAGFTALEYGDLGKTFVQGSHDGRIVGWDAATRTIYVDPTVWGTDTFPGGAAVAWTITSGTGSGTQTSAATSAVYWDDCGATATNTAYPRTTRRSDSTYHVGEYMTYPASSSAVWYVCYSTESSYRQTEGAAETASAAPSFNTGLGQFTADGNVTWMRVNVPCPTTLPSADVPDALFTHVTDVSGTTVTLADDATTSVTSQLVMHDDTDAFQAWHTQMRALATPVSTLHVAKGDYQLILGKFSGTGADARLVNPSGTLKTVFYFAPTSGQSRMTATWNLDNANVWFCPLSSSSEMSDSPDNYQFLSHAYSKFKAEGGGIICAPLGEPTAEHSDIWSGVIFSSENTNANVRMGQLVLRDIDILGFPSVIFQSGEQAFEQSLVLSNVNMDYGGPTHAFGLYVPSGWIWGGSLIGRGAYRSTGIYQDFNSNDVPFKITGFYGEGWRNDGFRVRQSDVTLRDCHLVDCKKVYATETIDNFEIAGGRYDRTSIIITATTDAEIHHAKITDSVVSTDSLSSRVKIHHNEILAGPLFPAALYSTSMNQVSLDGQDVQLDHNTIECYLAANPWTADLRGINLSGTGVFSIDHNTVKGASATRLISASATGFISLDHNYFRTMLGSVAPTAFSGGAQMKWTKNIWEASNTACTITVANVLRFDIDGDTFNTAFSLTSAATGPVYIRNAMMQSSTATSIAEPNTILDGNNFAVAPTLTGTTLATSNNRVADAKVLSPSALGTTSNDLALGVTDTHRLDPNAANTVLSSIVARAGGTTITIICVDAGAATLTLLDDDGATGTAANRIVTPDGADIVLSNNETVVLQYDATAQRWKVIGGGYSAIFNRDAQRAFDGSLALAA
jgi:hypothetical protein